MRVFFQGSIGIDITSERIHLLYLKSLLNKSTLFASKSHDFDLSLPLDKRIHAAAEWISAFIMENKAEAAEVHVGIPGKLAIMRTLSFPAAVRENLSTTLLYEMEKYIPLPIDEIHYDHQIISEDKVNRTLTLLLMIVKKKDLEPYLELKHLIYKGISSIGTGSGGLTNFLGKFYNFPDRSWYWAARKSEHETFELNGISNRFLKLSRTIGYNDICGEGFDEELTQPAGESLGRISAPVDLFVLDEELFSHLSVQCDEWKEVAITSLDFSATPLPDPAYAAAYGLALKGQEKVPMEINFLPRTYRKKPSRIAFYLMIALSVILFVSLSGLGVSYGVRKNQMLKKIDSELATISNDVVTISQIKADIGILEKKVLALDKIAKGNIPVSVIVRDLSQRIPKSAWLKDLEISDNSVRLTGVAGKASELISILEQSPYYKEAAFLSTLVKDKDGMDSFQIGAKLNPSGYPDKVEK